MLAAFGLARDKRGCCQVNMIEDTAFGLAREQKGESG